MAPDVKEKTRFLTLKWQLIEQPKRKCVICSSRIAKSGVPDLDLAIQAGRVVLRQASVESLRFPAATFDKAFSSNTFQFWPDQVSNLQEVRRTLKPDGTFAIVLQPRWAKTDDEVRAIARETADKVTTAGFRQVRIEYKPMKPVMAFCVLAAKA